MGGDVVAVRAMRSVVQQASAANARLTAAAIGGSLARLADAHGGRISVSEATDRVRDAAFDLVSCLSRDAEAARAKQLALRSLDELELAVEVATSAAEPVAITTPDAASTPRPWSRLRAFLRMVVPAAQPAPAHS